VVNGLNAQAAVLGGNDIPKSKACKIICDQQLEGLCCTLRIYTSLSIGDFQ